ncbi:MAG: hypothetical protein U5O39_09910 [Gammaproteobacteria bacterium]|nr:hypothetical protein [Gammaproteobacteria bacterium]
MNIEIFYKTTDGTSFKSEAEANDHQCRINCLRVLKTYPAAARDLHDIAQFIAKHDDEFMSAIAEAHDRAV